MRAAIVAEGGHFEVKSVPEPDVGPDQVLVRVAACGVCGSDVHMRRAGLVFPGMSMGHEIGGTVEALGSDVEGWAVGDAVAVMPTLPCGACAQCSAGRPQLCINQTPYTMGLGIRPGGLAEYVSVWPGQLFRLPDGVPPHVGALAEPLAVGFHGVAASGIGAGERAVVLGGGSIGVMAAVGLRATGVTDFFVSEPVAVRRETLGLLGFETCEPAAAMSRSHAPSVVFDCTGVGSVLQEATQIVASGGTVVLLGVVEVPTTVLPVVWMVKEVTIRGVLAYGGAFPDAVASLADGRVDTAPLSAHVVPLEATEETFDRLATADAPPKILVDPWL
ncbi:MAG: alcohol dehydrogenase catalytic domain-containing protein [Acidimicrobiia bacterium]|nr:alcohol dehydrogenase catalytic domain-containing protein [Acidimicrobiia bacterium]